MADVEAISSQNDIPWLAALRIYRGVTQKELAISMGLYLEEYQDLECSPHPDGKLLERAIISLGIPIEVLQKRSKDKTAA